MTDAPSPLLVDRAGLAQMLDVSVRQIDRLDSGGKLPKAIPLGRCKRWNVEEIKTWIAEGAPPRSRWNLRSALAAPRAREQGQ
jgi:predicted DNA-binding transcriptional regulator AlpA